MVGSRLVESGDWRITRQNGGLFAKQIKYPLDECPTGEGTTEVRVKWFGAT